MATEQVGGPCHRDQNAGQQQVVARGGPPQQQRVGDLVDEKAAPRNAQEAQPGAADRSAMTTKTEPVVAGERHHQGDHPADHVGLQGRPVRECHHAGGDAPMDGSGGASDHHKPADASSLCAGNWRGMGGAVSDHGGTRQHSSWRSISLCVDDFGLHPGINEAVFTLVRQGRVQAVSAMVGGAAWPEGARGLLAVARTGRVEVGLHLDLTECPLNPANRQPLGHLIARAYLHQLDPVALRAEVAGQLDAFEAAMGCAPAYVDGHQHVHQLPQVRAALLQELARRYPAGGLWLRATRGPQGAAHLDARTRFKSQVIAWLGARALSSLAQRQGLRQNARLLGVYDFRGDAAQYRARLDAWLHACRHGDLLMCHAGRPSPGAPDVLEGARQAELEVLGSAGFEDALKAARVRLAPMGQILAGLPAQ